MGRKQASSPESKFARVSLPGVRRWFARRQSFASIRIESPFGAKGRNVILSPPYKDWADYFTRAPRSGRTSWQRWRSGGVTYCRSRRGSRSIEGDARHAICISGRLNV